MNSDKTVKIVMLVLLIGAVLLLLYTAKNIMLLQTNPCKVCMDKMPQMRCYPFIEGLIEPAQLPNWVRPIMPTNMSYSP